MNHFLPTAMDVSARALIALPLRGVAGAVPVSSSQPLVEVGVINAAGRGAPGQGTGATFWMVP